MPQKNSYQLLARRAQAELIVFFLRLVLLHGRAMVPSLQTG
jgi:hypothetical protein